MLNKTYETPPFRDLHPYLFGWGTVSIAILVITAIIVIGIIILERNQTNTSKSINSFEKTLGVLLITSFISTITLFGIFMVMSFQTDHYQTYEGNAKVERLTVADDNIHERYITLSDHGNDATYRVSEDKVKGIHQHDTVHVKIKMSPQLFEEKAPKHRQLSDLASYVDVEDTSTNKIEYDDITFEQ